jgi:DNA-binding transcriptional MerR regulator
METVTLKHLVADTGETPRVINHWTDLGILRAERTSDRQGRGNRRFYRAEPMYGERKWALLASAYAKLRFPLIDIKRLIFADRLSFDPIEFLDLTPLQREQVEHIRAQREEDKKTNPDFVFPFEAALKGEQNVLALTVLRPVGEPTPILTTYLRQAANERDKVMAAKANNMLLLNRMSDEPLGVVVNLSLIFKPLYTTPEQS